MLSRKKKEMDFTTKVVIFIGIFIISAFLLEHIIFWFKGAAPVEIYIATIPPIMTEIIAICKLTLDKRKYEFNPNSPEIGPG